MLLCDDHHHEYHQKYPKVNPKTFIDFLMKKSKNMQSDALNFKFNNELKISKLRKIIKLLNNTQNKVVKISVNNNLYDISKITDTDEHVILDLKNF